MTDQVLREAQRRARETGSVEDEAAYLRARVRAGDLDRTRLRLAARLGHSAARLLADDLAVSELIVRSQLSAHTPSRWGWRTRPEDRDALLVVAATVQRFRLVPFRGRPGGKPGTKSYVRYVLRHLSPEVDRDEVTETIRANLLTWALRRQEA